ncbi:glycosyl transferase [Agrobacterium vitis]|uniref:O-linked N-acetylglucosamine transferase, SPINDLY family protein n=1 Tax=Agrobacterium vitis TaxID=373 RepID=UPI0012E84B88|nr:glycosyl transferase [Agrobacterium vitis]MVA82062.1 glycosyl transferase [Agrobacterium vitis]
MTLDAAEKVTSSYAQGLFQQALDEFDALLPTAKQDPRMVIMAAQCHYRLGHLETAADHYSVAADRVAADGIRLNKVAFELYKKVGHTEKAFASAERILQVEPRDHAAAFFHRHHLFDFLRLDELKAANDAALAAILAGDEFAMSCELPFNILHWCSDESIQARILGEGQPDISPQIRAMRRQKPHVFGDKVRIGYLSNDFSSSHATMILLQGVLERHDRSRFEIILYCYSSRALVESDNGSRARMGMIKQIGDLSDAAASTMIQNDDLDILVDLKGHTKDARIGLVNSGLAPIQVAWLGFPGSGIGIDCDYIISDPIVTPQSSKPFYQEKFCRLPETYQPNDNINRPLPSAVPRAALGLPQDRFILASFNSIKKLSPQTVEAWLRIMTDLPDSLLWILCRNDIAKDNLRTLFARHGLSAKRLIFTPPRSYPYHLARLSAADLVLDSFPCCGHTTTSDCLWAGVPVLALKGQNFASRVSESLLTALGVPELVAETVDDYIAQAQDLARNRNRLQDLRDKIAANRHTMPLFDTERFTRHLEDAYAMMVARARAGLEPDHMDVPARPFL